MTSAWIELYVKLILFIVFFKVIGSATFKGWMGELLVKFQLSRLDKDVYKIVNDVTIKLDDGKTAQIDHIVVSEYGVFVIETKNYKGWIVGKEEDYYWKQVIYKRKEKFYNPLKQNQVHIDRLTEVLSHISEIPLRV
ncbi:MAG: NERD domain-containing protein [Peptostreptococcaceae bacterium]|nr:NERD domain-containing protein [Peptostreptococcaceae bacterium]